MAVLVVSAGICEGRKEDKGAEGEEVHGEGWDGGFVRFERT